MLIAIFHNSWTVTAYNQLPQHIWALITYGRFYAENEWFILCFFNLPCIPMEIGYGKQIYSISYKCRTIQHKITKAIMLKQLSHQPFTLQRSHNGRDGVSNDQPHDCLLSRVFMRRSKKTSKLGVTGLCAGNSPVTGEFPVQRASYAEMLPFDDVNMKCHCYGGFRAIHMT